MYSALKVGYIESSNDIFNHLTLSRLETDNFRICCLVTERSICSVSIPWYFSCGDLLLGAEIKISFYIVYCTIVLGNFALLIIQIVKHSLHRKEMNSAFSPVQIAVNMIDMSLSVPFMIVWVADLLYENNFWSKSAKWSHSIFCFMVFGCFLFYNLASPVMLVLSCIIRLRVVVKPLSSNFKYKHFIVKWVVSLVLLSIIWSTLSTILTKYAELDFSEKCMSLSICSPFVDPGKTITMSRILTICATLVQIITCTGIAAMYYHVYNFIKKSEEATQNPGAKRQSDNIYLKIHLSILVITNFICWLPCCVVYITTMFLSIYPIPLVLWTTATIMPLNAIVNPSVETITTLRKHFKQVVAKALIGHQLVPVTLSANI